MITLLFWKNNHFINSVLGRNFQLCIIETIEIAFYSYSKAKELNTEELVSLLEIAENFYSVYV